MDLDRLLSEASVLIEHMRDDGHSESYVRQVSTEINWLRGNGRRYDSYESACHVRESQTESGEMRRRYRLMYGILRRFDEDDVLPDFRPKEPLFRRGAYHQLDPRFRSVVDAFVADGKARGLKDKTIKGYASAGSLFLLAMQKRGRGSLEDVTEEDVLSLPIQKMFAMVEIGERAGSGMDKFYAGWEWAGYGEPTYEVGYGPDRTTLVLPLRESDVGPAGRDTPGEAESLSDSEREAIRIAAVSGRVTTRAVVQATGLSRQASATLLRRLSDRGILKWHGKSANDPHQYYSL